MNKIRKVMTLPALASAVTLSTGLLLVSNANAAPLPPTKDRTNVALDKKVLFSPPPTKSPGKNGSLTDGKISKRVDHDLSQDDIATYWSYAGKVNLAVDLGEVHDIDEIAIRLQNGSPVYTTNSGRMFPRWVEAYVSNDGEHYKKVAEFSPWGDEDAFKKFDIGENRGSTWIDTLRFKDLKAQGRWVGLRIDSTSRTLSDELYVFGKPANDVKKVSDDSATGFTVTHPEIHFHKPYLELATNAPLPIPIGMAAPKGSWDINMDIDVPPGIEIKGGSFGDGNYGTLDVKPETLPNGWQRYSFAKEKIKAERKIGRFFMQATSWEDGQKGEIKYRFGNDGDNSWQSPWITLPVNAVKVPAAPQLKKIMVGLGYWKSASNTGIIEWPDEFDTYKIIGLNTYSAGIPYTKDPNAKSLEAIEKARDNGFFIATTSSPFVPLVRNHRDKKGDKTEIFDIYEDGSHSNKLCPAYRGKYYWQEIEHYAKAMAAMKPQFNSLDMELWGAAISPDFNKDCLRCQADRQASGMSWTEWRQQKGTEIVSDLVNMIRKEQIIAGNDSFTAGLYNVSPEHLYQGDVYNFDQLYPDVLDNSQGSTYSSLQPADIVFIGDKARNARKKMDRSDVMPVITPGDAGSFPGKDLQWTMLECYTNGSRGIWFWSDRLWDSEYLIANNKVTRAIAPVEDVIVDGDLVGHSAFIDGPGRLSGMKLDSRMVLLAADYFGESDGTLKLFLDLPEKSQLRDLLTGETIGEPLLAGKQSVSIPLNGESARLLEVAPQ